MAEQDRITALVEALTYMLEGKVEPSIREGYIVGTHHIEGLDKVFQTLEGKDVRVFISVYTKPGAKKVSRR